MEDRPIFPDVSPVRKEKKNAATPLAIVSLLLSVILLGSLIATVFYFTDLTEKQREEYESLLDEIASDGGNGGSDSYPQINATPQDVENAQIVIDQNSHAVATVVSTVRPSVVCVCVTVPSQTIDYGHGFQGTTEEGYSTGSGVVWSEDGYIITNQHVVEYAQIYSNAYITIVTDDGTEYDAKLIAADKQTDLALLKVDGATFEPLEIGSSHDLLVGQTAIAVGNPLGIEYANSVTVGIVSGLDRQVTGENGVSTMIQTDAAVNPGNSGGALVDSSGKLIGIVSAKIADTSVEGIGFAIPIDDAIEIVTSLKEHGYVKGRPATGIADGIEITSYMSQRYKLPVGFYVTTVTDASAAEKAGIREKDVILSFGDTAITTLDDIEQIKKRYKVGDTVLVIFYRNGNTHIVELTLQEDKG